MAKRILNRKDLRADFDAAERRKSEDEEPEDEDEEEGEEDEEAAETEEEAAEEPEEEAPAPAPKKRKAAKPKAAKPKTRSRAAKVTRMKVVWGVFNNSNQCVATFDYPKRRDAEDLVAKLTVEKKNTHFIQPVKEPMEEKKD